MKQQTFTGLWGMPIALGLLTVAGLACALVGDGIWDHLSAVALSAPVLTGAWFGLRKPRDKTPRD